MKNASWNNVLLAGTSTSFGFTANFSGTPTVPTGVSCTSP
jgi:chitin-binding protein